MNTFNDAFGGGVRNGGGLAKLCRKPPTVFIAMKSELKAVHAVAGNFQLHKEELKTFDEAGFINQVASFAVGQRWRPWQSELN